MTGEIIDIDEDDLGKLTGTPEDDYVYTLELENGETPGIWFRQHDLQSID